MKYNTTWSAWIDETRKIITVKEQPNAKQVFFENKEIGMKTIIELVSKGYKIG